MAIDPTTGAPSAPSGWSLGALGAPSQSTAPLPVKPQFGPEQIAQMRKEALALQTPPTEPIRHWTQGLAELVRAIQGNREADFARQQEMQGRQQGADAISQIYAPYLSPGGNSAAAPAGATPAGTQGGAPVGAAPTTATTTADAADASADPYVSRLFAIESGGNPSAVSPGGRNKGLAQFSPDLEAKYGITDANRSDPAVQAAAVQQEQREHTPILRSTLGRDPTPGELYLMHQQGIAGGPALLTADPNQPAWRTLRPFYRDDATAKSAILGNLPRDSGLDRANVDRITSGQFANYWKQKFEGGLQTAAAPAAAPAGPTGLLAPIQPPAAAARAAPPPIPANQASAQPPTRLAYAGADIPPGMLPPQITQGGTVPRPRSVFDTGAPPVAAPGISSIVNAIAGRPPTPAAPPPAPSPQAVPDFARQAAELAARSNRGPAVPLSPAQSAAAAPAMAPPNPDFARQLAALDAATAGQRGPSVPLSPDQAAAVTPQPPNPNFASQVAALSPAADRGPAVPISPGATNLPGFPPPPPLPLSASAVAAPVPAPPGPPEALPPGSAVPGAVGPTSVGGTPLVPPGTGPLPPPVGPTSVNGRPLPQPGGITPQNAALVGAISGQPAGPGGAPNAPPPIRVAQNGPPTGAVPVAARSPAAAPPPVAAPGVPAGLPQPLTPATGQITQDQLTRVLANPWVPEQTKAAMLQMIQQRGQPQTMPVEGGTLMYNAAGQRVFIPEPKFGTVKIGSAEVPTVSHFDPATQRWTTTTLAPGGGVQTAPAVGGGAGGPPDHPGLPQAPAARAEPDLSTIGGIQANEAAQAAAKKGAETAAEQGAKTFNTIKTGITGDAFNASRQEPIIDTMARIAPAAFPGAGTDALLELHRVAAQFGLDPNSAAPRELFNQLSAKLLGDQFANIRNMSTEEGSPGGRIFKSMLDLEEKANITPQDSLAGVQAKLAFMKKAGQMLQRWGDMADDYAATHNHQLDESFMKTLRHDLAKQNFDDILPKADANSPTGTKETPVSKVINGKTYYQIGGKVYDNPDGK